MLAKRRGPPSPDGYAVRLTLKSINPAALVAGDRVDVNGCGGPLREPYTDLEIPVEVSLAA